MLKLMLLRHAKSDRSKDASARGDHARPLSERGRRSATLMGKHMLARKYVPSLVLCSTAERTRATWDLVREALEASPEVQYEDALYLADWPKLLEAVRATPDAPSPLLMIGHNPGMEQLAMAMTAKAKSSAARALANVMAEKFPTGALAVLSFRGESWEDIKPGRGRLADFVRPKDIAADGDDD